MLAEEKGKVNKEASKRTKGETSSPSLREIERAVLLLAPNPCMQSIHPRHFRALAGNFISRHHFTSLLSFCVVVSSLAVQHLLRNGLQNGLQKEVFDVLRGKMQGELLF